MKKRIQYIDIAKGILITLTVFGHIFHKGFIRNFIYTFHMPAFFVISGIVLKPSTFEEPIATHVKKRFKSLIIPFILFEFIGILKEPFREGFTLNYKGYLFNSITLILNNGPDWFLIALFFVGIIFVCIHKVFKKDKTRIIITIATCLILLLGQRINNVFGQIGIGLLFLTFGYHSTVVLLTDNCHYVMLAGIIALIITVLNGTIDVRGCHFNNFPLFVLGAVSGTFFTLGVSRVLETRDKLMTFYGQNTLTILGTHNCIIPIIVYYTKINEFDAITGTITFFLVMFIEIIVINIFNQYIPFLVGKPPYSNNSLLNLIYPNKKQRC